jgi:hypothetical protein
VRGKEGKNGRRKEEKREKISSFSYLLTFLPSGGRNEKP